MQFIALLFTTFVIIEARGPHVAPYVDITYKEGPRLAEISKQTGVKAFTLAFALGGTGGCAPSWGGTIPLDDHVILDQVKEFKAMGGEVIVATGGAAGPYIETSCGTAQALAGAYKHILDTVGTSHLDVDVEASINLDTVNQALAMVQHERPDTTVSFTLMVQGDDFGVTTQLGVDLLKNAVKHGVRVDIVNPMTMEFGSRLGSWGDAVIAAAQATLKQMKEIWPQKSDAELKQMLGVTPMIGRNFNGKVFEVSHARQLIDWANKNQIGKVAFWSIGRDNGGCPGGGISPKCSSIAEGQYEFAKIFNGFRHSGNNDPTTESHNDKTTKDHHHETTPTPEPHTKTTPHHSGPFTCSSPGFFADPSDKHKFHECVDAGNGKFTNFSFNCGAGTAYDPNNHVCGPE